MLSEARLSVIESPNLETRVRVHVVDARQLHLGERLPGGPLDRLEQMPLTRGHEQQRLARTAGAAGTADAVHVGLGVVRDVVVDDVGDAVDVETTRGDIGGDEDVERARLQLADGAFTLRLHDVAVDRGGGETTRAQLLGQLLGGLLGAHEDDHRLEGLDLEDASQGVELALMRHLHVALGDVGAVCVLDLTVISTGSLQVLLGDLADRARHGRREQRDLLVLGGVARGCARRPPGSPS